jgi:hypothetical protein
MDKRFNKIYVGLAAGLILPVIVSLIFNLVAFENLSPGEFIRIMINREKLSALISLVVLPNLLVFFIFIWLNYLYSARGVLAATLVFALLVLITKYLI